MKCCECGEILYLTDDGFRVENKSRYFVGGFAYCDNCRPPQFGEKISPERIYGKICTGENTLLISAR